MRRMATIALVGVMAAGAAVHADVRVEQRTRVRFEGALGRMAGLFGGGAARDGVVNTVSVKGDRRLTRSEQTAEIVDLQEERVYQLDLRNRTYTVTTFAETRQKMEEARRQAAAAARDTPQGASPANGQQPQVEVDVAIAESGARRAVNGFDAREVVLTITVRQRGQTLEQAGGMVMTSNLWLAAVMPGMKEIADFERRYAEKLGLAMMVDAEQMAAMAAMYPMLTDAMTRMQAESVKLEGTPVLTVVSLQTVAAGTPPAAAAPQPAPQPQGGGGLRGRIGGLLGRGGGAPQPAPQPQSGGRSTVFTTEQEVVSVSTVVAEADLQVPQGFRQR